MAIKSRKAVFFGVPVLAAFVLLGAGALGASAPADLGVPTTVAFSARLSEDDAPPDGPLDMTFTIYDKAIGGMQLWQETHSQVSVEAGFVSVQLGSDVPLDAALFDGSARFVEIAIGSTKLDPRIPIASVPYALRAGEAKHAVLADTASSANHASAADTATSADSASKLGTLAATDIQKRVTGTCSMGQQIRAVNADGTVTCDASVSDAQFANQATARCKWMVVACSTAQCEAACPVGSHVEGGGCDLAEGSPLAESRPASSTGAAFSAGANPVTVFDEWICRTADESAVQGAYATCCTN